MSNQEANPAQAQSAAPSPETNVLLFPRDPSNGAIGDFAKFGRLKELQALETEKAERVWEVRAFISDSVPLSGDAAEALARPCNHKLRLNENPLHIYLHKGGQNAIYFELVGGRDNYLEYIAVQVETCLPDNALLLARGPINALLDVLTRDNNLPLVIQRLELISPNDSGVLINEMLVPSRHGIEIGPLGGILQAEPFAPYDALYREGLTSSSPFYRFLCAWKIYEGTNHLRHWIRKECARLNIDKRMPSDPDVDPQELINMGFDGTLAAGTKKAGDLFSKLKDQRDAIAHFLIDRGDGQSHVYVADGMQLRIYAIGASVLLRYAQRVMTDLRHFYLTQIGLRGSMLLPTPEHRDQFIIRAKSYGIL